MSGNRSKTPYKTRLGAMATACAVVVALALPLSSCATAGGQTKGSTRDETMKTGVAQMLEEIYSSRKPVRFEQLDVSPIVLKHIPLGTDKAAVSRLFAGSASSKIVEDDADTLVVRDNKGQAMLDPDARSVVITFSFDAAGKLAKVDAVHLKNQ